MTLDGDIDRESFKVNEKAIKNRERGVVKPGRKSLRDGWVTTEEIEKKWRNCCRIIIEGKIVEKPELTNVWLQKGEKYLEHLWERYSTNKLELEEFRYSQKYTDKNGRIKHRLVSDTKPVYAYVPETSNLSWICEKCICHESCPGYYYEQFGAGDGFDGSLYKCILKEIEENSDIIQSLKKLCECPHKRD